MPSPKAFLETQNYESKPPRNSYDNSKSCNMTGKLGGIYPCGLWEVNSGDSFQIESAFAFNFFPTVFPLQTPLTARIYYFYGRDRVMQDSFKDMIYNNKQPVPPYIAQSYLNRDFWRTGSLSDYLGVPTTYSSMGREAYSLKIFDFYRYASHSAKPSTLYCPPVTTHNNTFLGSGSGPLRLGQSYFSDHVEDPKAYGLLALYDKPLSKEDLLALPDAIPLGKEYSSVRFCVFFTDSYSPDSFQPVTLDSLSSLYLMAISNPTNRTSFILKFIASSWFYRQNAGSSSSGSILSTADIRTALASYLDNPLRRAFIGFIVDVGSDPDNTQIPLPYYFNSETQEYEGKIFNGDLTSGVLSVSSQSSVLIDIADGGSSYNPFCSESGPQIPLSAIPYRFYEALYNAYFRDEKNDPFVVDGEIEYNKYNTTTADGPDQTNYRIKFRNWDADFLTTASQTPQQGLAPLVGINVRGDMEFLNDDGTIAKVRPTIAPDGETITGIEGVVENGTPEAMRSALDLISSGISINDFRQVNSLQRWLENNIRRGLKYRDQVLANTGVKIKYDELDMPVFIGGYSRPIQMQQITQTSPSSADDNALGDRAGQLGVFGGSKHKITHYCDEAGFIMAVVCITPTPVYSQLLPKYFLKQDALSYYHPQFGHIGMQPIDYREVCPVQAYKDGRSVFDVFGYQRAWYDLVGCVDEVHGQMRTTMRDFVMNRTFSGVPELGSDFLHIDPKQLNQVFAYTDEEEDVFQGQIYHRVYVKRAIPRFGIPRLE